MKFLFQNSSFRFFLTLSFSLHVGLALLAFIFSKSFLFQSKDKILVIENAIQVDQIELSNLKKLSSSPANKNQTLPSLPKTSQKKQPLKAKKEKILNLKKEKTKKLDQKEEKKDKSDRKKKEQVTPDPNEKDQNKSDTEKEILEESTDPELSSAKSDDTNSDDSQLSSEQISEISHYANGILRQIRANWQIPSYLTNKNLTTQLEIKIDSQGRVIYKEILISAGDDIYDSFVLKTIEKGSPYLKPSDSVQKIIKNGIVLNIPSQ